MAVYRQHSLTVYTTHSCTVAGVWSQCQSITGLMNNLESAINILCMFLDCRKKPENLPSEIIQTPRTKVCSRESKLKTLLLRGKSVTHFL